MDLFSWLALVGVQAHQALACIDRCHWPAKRDINLQFLEARFTHHRSGGRFLIAGDKRLGKRRTLVGQARLLADQQDRARCAFGAKCLGAGGPRKAAADHHEVNLPGHCHALCSNVTHCK